MKKKKVYECFSTKLHMFLMERGFEKIGEYVHNKTNKTCFQYEMTEELSQALTEWSESNPYKVR